MTRLYVVTDVATGAVIRYVRAASLNSAVRAVANERFDAAVMSADAVYTALRAGADVLDVTVGQDEGPDDEDDEPNAATDASDVVTEVAHVREVAAAKGRLAAAPSLDEPVARAAQGRLSDGRSSDGRSSDGPRL
jgi:hypothetical protein